MRVSIVLFIASVLALTAAPALAQEQATTLDQLLEQVKEGRVRDNQENRRRIERFRADKANQAQELRDAKQMRVDEEQRSERLETAFDENEQEIAVLQQTLTERLGSLKELFGVLQQAAGDARGQFESSLTQIQFPERTKFLTELSQKMGQTSRLASIEEIERLWFELQREMTESGKVVKFDHEVIRAAGTEVEQEVVRIGVFNLVSNGEYLVYNADSGNISELPGQGRGEITFGFTNPVGAALVAPIELAFQGIIGFFPDPWERYREGARALQQASSGFTQVAADPTRGQLLSLSVEKPQFSEQVEAGGAIGYIIIVLGAIAILLAVVRYVWLLFVGMQVAAQKRNLDNPSGGNPLGRVLKVYEESKGVDLESLELRLSEAVLKETPRLNMFNTLIKVIAVVAPLMGLLGTVVGMIVTFQAITLFGTGDPKIMAGGISQALTTTVEGLCVAIPVTLLYTLVSGRSRRIIQILEEQTTGLIAQQAEAGKAGAKPAA